MELLGNSDTLAKIKPKYSLNSLYLFEQKSGSSIEESPHQRLRWSKNCQCLWLHQRLFSPVRRLSTHSPQRTGSAGEPSIGIGVGAVAGLRSRN